MTEQEIWLLALSATSGGLGVSTLAFAIGFFNRGNAMWQVQHRADQAVIRAQEWAKVAADRQSTINNMLTPENFLGQPPQK